MKKIVYAMLFMLAVSSIGQAAPAWVATKLQSVSIFNGTIYIVYNDGANKYLVYTGTGATDSTTLNRIYATCLTAIANDYYVEAYTDLAAPISTSTYGFQGLRVRDTTYTP